MSRSDLMLATLVMFATARPALAQSSAVPEPSSLLLLGLGVAGVVIGRQSSRRRND